MDARDRIVVALSTIGVVAVVTGLWLRFSLAIALIVGGALVLVGALAVAQGGSTPLEATAAQDESSPVEAEAPEIARVRMRSPVAIVPTREAAE